MEIKDLKDPRDRAAMEWAQRRPTIHEERKKDSFYRVVHNEDGSCHPECRVVSNFDQNSDREFQTGRRAQQTVMPANYGKNSEGRAGNIGLRFGKSEE